MSTPTATATVTTVVTSTAVLNTSIAELCNAQSTVEGKWTNASNTFRSESAAKGYDRSQCAAMLKLAYAAYAEKLAKADKLSPEATAAYVAAYCLRKAPDMSKIITLAFPKDDAAAAEFATLQAHNATAKGDQKLGVNEQLKVARGKATVASILEERAAAKAGKGAQNGGAPRIGSGTTATTTPTAYDAATAMKMATDFITYVVSVGKRTTDDADTLFAEAMVAYAAAVASPK